MKTFEITFESILEQDANMLPLQNNSGMRYKIIYEKILRTNNNCIKKR